MNNQEFWIWLAGFIDGEGTISIEHGKASPRRKCGWYYPRISIYNSSKETINFICKRLTKEGIRYSIDKRKRSEKSLNCYSITISGLANVLQFALKVKSHLFTKRKQIKILISFAKSRLSKMEISRKEPYSSDDLKLCEKIRKLNQRGVRHD